MDRKGAPSNAMAVLAFVFGAVLGGRARAFLYRNLLGYSIDRSAELGISFIRVGHLDLGPRAKIGGFTIIRNIDFVSIGENARIGTFNWIYGFPGRSARHFAEESERRSEFVMERDSSLTSRHIVDCTNRVVIREFATVAGFCSQIITHGIDIADNRQRSAPVTIGRRSMVGSGSILTKGAVLPDYSVLGAGSVLRDAPGRTHALYSGVPAVFVAELDHESGYFTRDVGPVA